MKKTTTTFIALAVISAGIAGAGIASAHGMFGPGPSALTPEEQAQHQQTMFEHKAELLGVSSDTVKQAWAEGKTLSDIAEEQGISEEELRSRLQDAHKQRRTEHMNTMIEQGVITQEQADQHLEVMAERMSEGGGPRDFKNRSHKGFGFR